MTSQSNIRPFIFLFSILLFACSDVVSFSLIGEKEVSEIVRAELSGGLAPPNSATSIESKNSVNPDGFFAYYFVSDDKVSELIENKDMHALFYEIVECANPTTIIYSDQAYRLTSPPIELKSHSSQGHYAVYIPKKYPELFKLINKSSGQKYKASYDNLSAQCLQFRAGAMTGSNLKSNLITLVGK